MSVPKSRRKTSNMAYIEHAELLAASVFRIAVRLPKRYAFMIGNPLFDHAEQAVYHCKAANMVFVNDDASFSQRRGHLVEAESHITHVETLLSILYRLTSQLAAEGQCKAPNDNVYAAIADIILEERKLISGCKRRDTASYNSRREAGGGGAV